MKKSQRRLLTRPVPARHPQSSAVSTGDVGDAVAGSVVTVGPRGWSQQVAMWPKASPPWLGKGDSWVLGVRGTHTVVSLGSHSSPCDGFGCFGSSLGSGSSWCW